MGWPARGTQGHHSRMPRPPPTSIRKAETKRNRKPTLMLKKKWGAYIQKTSLLQNLLHKNQGLVVYHKDSVTLMRYIQIYFLSKKMHSNFKVNNVFLKLLLNYIDTLYVNRTTSGPGMEAKGIQRSGKRLICY